MGVAKEEEEREDYRSDGRNPKRVRELKRWREMASLAISGLPPPTCDAAKEFELWVYDNRRALAHALVCYDGEQQGLMAWKQFHKATQRFCCAAVNMPHSDGKAAVKAFETAMKISIRQGLAGATPFPGKVPLGRSKTSLGFTSLPERGGGAHSPGMDRGGSQSPAFRSPAFERGGAHSPSLPSLTPSRLTHDHQATLSSGRMSVLGGKGHEEDSGGYSVPDNVSVSTRFVRSMPVGHVTALLQRGSLDKREREIVRKAQGVQWRRLYDEKREGNRGPASPPENKDQPVFDPSKETREEREKRRKAERDELRRVLVERHKTKKREREVRKGIFAGELDAHGNPFVDHIAVDSAAAAAKKEEERFRRVFEEEERVKKYNYAIKKKLTVQMQAHFKNTRTLPIDLFRAFQHFDKDRSGYIDFQEFKQVLKVVGLGMLSGEETKQMFDQCDGDSSGRVDFAEFLKTFVGNMTRMTGI